MKNAYPVIMEKDGDGFVVSIPDFRLDTQGDSIQDAIEMARDAIGIAGVVLEDKGAKLPEASGYEEALKKRRMVRLYLLWTLILRSIAEKMKCVL